MELFLLSFASIFSVMNPLGTVPIFVGLTIEDDKKEIKRTSLFTAIDAFIILMLSFFLGKYILTFFGISINSLKIAGGLIIASSGFALLTGSFNKHKGIDKPRIKADIKNREIVSLTPLAIPMLAGPGTISLLISLHKAYVTTANHLIIISALFATCLVIYLMLRGSSKIVKYLGASGLNAVSRIIGFIVISIGVEYISSTVVALFSTIN